ncbi:MAG: PEP-CTERM sorting domain-containing protein [Acidobacteriaceae bacterium]|nr:PEP-CTERM sorting domain-containing protein [Acidobacteriaceae bacterium]
MWLIPDLRLFSLALVICGASASVYADSITNFNLSAALEPGTAQGTITIDTTNGQVTGGNFTVNAPTPPGLAAVMDVFTTLRDAGYNGANQIADFVSGTDRFELSLPLVSLVGYSGSSVCSTTERTGCTIANSPSYYPTLFIYFGGELADAAVSGSLTPSSAPEPSTYLLLATGLVGVIGAARKRLTTESLRSRLSHRMLDG